MLDVADSGDPGTVSVGQRALVDATLARIGPPYGRVLTDDEYLRLSRHLRLLGCGAPAVSDREGEVLHEWTIEGCVRLRMYSCRGLQGNPLSQGWLPVE